MHCPRYTDQEILVAYIRNKNLLTEQYKITKDNEIAVVLSKSLPKFPKLKAISFSYRHNGTYLPEYALELVQNSVIFPNCNLPHVGRLSRDDTAFRSIFRALKKTGVRIKSLSIAPQTNDHFEQRELLALKSKRSRNMAKNAFQSLTNVEMRFSPLENRHPQTIPHGNPPILSQTTPTAVAELLQNAKGLKRLSFGYNQYSYYSYDTRRDWSYFPLSLQLGDGFRWHHLESLELVNMALYDEEIVDFINLHAATLREVVLERIIIFSALGWNKVAEALQGLRLEGVRIIAPRALPKGGIQLEQRPGAALEKEIMSGRANRLRPGYSGSS